MTVIVLRIKTRRLKSIVRKIMVIRMRNNVISLGKRWVSITTKMIYG